MRFIVFFLLFIINSYSQELKGSVIDEMQMPISNANVQLLKLENNELITFSKTDEKGFFLFNLKGISFPLKIKITHFLFENKELKISSFKEVNLILKPRITELKEVIIENKQPDIVEKNDTLTYNLNTLLVGSELKLKDVLEKLPGITIDGNKKIKFKGGKIEALLINGDEFFRDNHQLAIENLTAEMVEKIEVLKNYKDLSNIDGFENEGQTALNINIKKTFRDSYKESFDAEGGVKERYKLHNNLFNFGNKNKLNIITDINNLNDNVFSPIDYIEMRKITGKNLLKDKLSIGIESYVENTLPPFIFSQDNINTISTKNNTINFARKPQKNKRYEFISILNQTRLTENNSSLQTFLDGTSSDILDKYQAIGESLYSSNVFKFENKISDKTYFQTNAYFFLSIDKQNQVVNNLILSNQDETLFDNNNDLNSLKTGFNTLYKSKISKKILLEGVIFNDYSFTKNYKNYNSNKNFIGFGFNENKINQDTNYQSVSFGLKAKATIHFYKSDLNVKFISTIDNETLSNYSNINSTFLFDDTYSIASNNISFLFSSSLTNRIKYNVGVEFANNNHNKSNSFERTINSWLPSINLSYKFTDKLGSSVGYSIKQNNPNINNFISGRLVENQRAYWLQSNLVAQEMLTDSFNTGLFYTDIPKNVFASFFILYSNNRNQITNSFFNSNVVTQQEYRYIDYGNSIVLNSFFSKKFKTIPMGLNFSAMNTFANRKAIANNSQNNNRYNQNTFDFSLKSYYKNKVNFDLGIILLSNFNSLKSQTSLSSSKLITTSPFVKLEGTVFAKKINWKLNSTYHIFNSSFSSSNTIFDTSFKINYLTKNKIDFFLNANNIFNIRDNNTKNNFSQNDLMTQQIIMNTLSGFINLGFTFSF